MAHIWTPDLFEDDSNDPEYRNASDEAYERFRDDFDD